MDGIVRIGTVSDVNVERRTARIYFPDVEIMSDFLKVLARPVGCGNPPDSVEAEPENDWMPKIGETVLCLYVPTWGGDGYILGALR